jgi:NAD(P)-dependent dehydrogenase (short-subunit alcohol dehydrogenase family)
MAVVLVTGASSGFGRLTANTLARAGHTVVAGMRATTGHKRLGALIPPDADVQSVADEIARVVGLPADERPFRTHVDPSRDGSEVVSAVSDRIRAEFYHRAGIADLLSPNAAL